MASTLSHWLHVREPADHAARSGDLARTVAGVVARAAPLSVLDLGTGTGSNVRYLAPRLPGCQRWLVVDRDPSVLEQLPHEMRSWGEALGFEVLTDSHGCVIRGTQLDCVVETRQLDLNRLPGPEIFGGRHLVTASALLDLVSEEWLRALAAQCRAAGAATLFALTYTGRSRCSPVEPDDGMIRELLNRHQKTDKGLGGAAAGPEASALAARCFEEAGYHVSIAASDWSLGRGAEELQQMLIEGWTVPAMELAPRDADRITRWRDRRLAHVRTGYSKMIVGHTDIAAWVP
jgi:hypothetical protein